jgi:hypothetical protein
MGVKRDKQGDPLGEQRRARAYQRGYLARGRKEEGQLWLEPHYPLADAELAMSWLDGWSDKGAEIQADAGRSA